MTANAVMDLVIEPIMNGVSSVIALPGFVSSAEHSAVHQRIAVNHGDAGARHAQPSEFGLEIAV